MNQTLPDARLMAPLSASVIGCRAVENRVGLGNWL